LRVTAGISVSGVDRRTHEKAPRNELLGAFDFRGNGVG